MYVCNEYRNSKKVGQILAVDGYFFKQSGLCWEQEHCIYPILVISLYMLLRLAY